MKKLKDEVIITNLRSNNQKTINQTQRYLYDTFLKYYKDFYTKKMGSKEDFEDLFQNKIYDFCRNVTNSQTVNYASSLQTYFGGMLKNGCVEFYRKRQNKIFVNFEDIYQQIAESATENDEKNSNSTLRNDLVEFNAQISSFKAITIKQQKELVVELKKALGVTCYEILRLKYTKTPNWTYEQILEKFTQYKSVSSLRSRVYNCKNEAQKILSSKYKDLLTNG